MRHAARALGLDVPDVERGRHELVGVDRVARREAAALPFGAADRTVEAALARDHDALGHVAQHRVGGAAERPPWAVAGRTLALLPHDLAAQHQLQAARRMPPNAAAEAPLRLPPKVAHVDAVPPARPKL